MNETVQSFLAALRQALGEYLRLDATSYVEMFAIDSVMECQFVPPGVAMRVEGRNALARHLIAVGELIEFTSMGEPIMRATGDPEGFSPEFEGFGRGHHKRPLRPALCFASPTGPVILPAAGPCS